MLPQIGLTEILALGMLALVVLGPRDLSLMMRRLGRWTGKARALAWEFRQSFEEIGRQAELEELKKEVEALKKSTTEDLSGIRKDINETEAEIARDAGVAEMKAKAMAQAKVAAAVEPSDPNQDEVEDVEKDQSEATEAEALAAQVKDELKKAERRKDAAE